MHEDCSLAEVDWLIGRLLRSSGAWSPDKLPVLVPDPAPNSWLAAQIGGMRAGKRGKIKERRDAERSTRFVRESMSSSQEKKECPIAQHVETRLMNATNLSWSAPIAAIRIVGAASRRTRGC